MALRMIEIYLSGGGGEWIEQILKHIPVIGVWEQASSEELTTVKVLLEVEKTEVVLDELEKHFGASGGFRVVLLPVEATLPRPEPPEKPPVDEQAPEKERPKIKGSRVSREELYSDLSETTNVSWVYVTFTTLSTVVAAIGLLQNNVAVIIGAMVIAPLLGPNVALALATTLGDVDLARRAAKANLMGILIAFGLSILIGFLFHIDPAVPEILSRTNVGLGDIVLALASGSAGALAFTTGVGASLIGVMVAVALLPPLVTTGLMLGSAHFSLALGSFLLLAVNIICINLSGVLTFFLQQVRPNTWWEADKARRATRRAIAILTVLLLLLVLVLVLVPRKGIESIRTPDGPVVISHQGAPKTYVYECNDGYGFTARTEAGRAWLFLPGQTVSLPLVPSGFDAKYSDGSITFQPKGDKGSLEIGEERHTDCTNNRAEAIWEDAKLRGVDFRARGNEPGWHMEITASEKILFVGDYGNSKYTFETPEPIVDKQARKTTYKTKDAQHDLFILIEGRPCQDTMSGESFDVSVTVALDGKEHQGCGKALH